MGAKSTSQRRITTLYAILLLVLGIGVFSVIDYFGDGLKASYNDAIKVRSSETEGKSTEIIYEIPITSEDMTFDMPIYDGVGVAISGRPSALDLEVTTTAGNEIKGLGGSKSFLIVSGFIYIAVFVFILMILTSLRSSVKRGELMKKHTVARTRVIAALLICASLSYSFSRYLENRAVADFLSDNGFSISVIFPFDFLQIGTGIVIFVIAEVFAIGYKLSEEQRLTI